MSSFGPAIAATAGTSRVDLPVASGRLIRIRHFFASANTPYAGSSTASSSLRQRSSGNVIFASMAGYAFSKINFKGRQWLFAMILVAMMIPYQVTQVPLYILIANKLQDDEHLRRAHPARRCDLVQHLPRKAVFHQHPHAAHRERKARRLPSVRDFREDHPAAFENRARGHGDQHVSCRRGTPSSGRSSSRARTICSPFRSVSRPSSLQTKRCLRP